jgi:hypothetical protein
MSDTAFQIQYRQEFIQAFEQHASLLRETVTTEAVIKGQQAVFLVAGSGGASAVTRGLNGRIPARNDSNAQNTCTLQEWHDLVRKTGFNVFASQGNQRSIMQMTTMAVLNRKIDELIINQLNTGTVAIGAPARSQRVAVPERPREAVQRLGAVGLEHHAAVPAVVPRLPRAGHRVRQRAVRGRQAVRRQRQNPSWRDKPMAYRWRNCADRGAPEPPRQGHLQREELPVPQDRRGPRDGHLRHAVAGGLRRGAGLLLGARLRLQGALLLQNTGVVVITHDGSAYA